MAANPYLNLFNGNNEQSLLNDLVVESIKYFGIDLVYLPRFIREQDKIFNETIINEFRDAIDVEMYIKSFEGFEGQGHLVAKFGLEIRDQLTLVLSKKSFADYIYPVTHKQRPMEGDCIYLPMTNNVFQIKYVEADASFFQLAKNYSWDISCELLEFSNEIFKTGRDYIDNLYKEFQHIDKTPKYKLEEYDKSAKNQEIQDNSDKILDWTEKNYFGKV